jgi:RHS repeat-associated protein
MSTTKYKFREQDFENNYFAMGARQYDSETGRFLSIDPLFESFRSITPYHYSFNSPLQWKDPSGLYAEDESRKKVGISVTLRKGEKLQDFLKF